MGGTTPLIESLQEILDRGYSHSQMLIVVHFPTRRHYQIRIPQDLNKYDLTEKVWYFRGSIP